MKAVRNDNDEMNGKGRIKARVFHEDKVSLDERLRMRRMRRALVYERKNRMNDTK